MVGDMIIGQYLIDILQINHEHLLLAIRDSLLIDV